MIVGIKCLPSEVYDRGDAAIRAALAPHGFPAKEYVGIVLRDAEIGGTGDMDGTNAWMLAPAADKLAPREAVFHFDDCISGDDAITRSQSRLVVGWLRRHIEDGERKVLVISCPDGCSRSGAVALMAASNSGLGSQACRRWNPVLKANPFVLEMLLAATAGLELE